MKKFLTANKVGFTELDFVCPKSGNQGCNRVLWLKLGTHFSLAILLRFVKKVLAASKVGFSELDFICVKLGYHGSGKSGLQQGVIAKTWYTLLICHIMKIYEEIFGCKQSWL